MLSTRARRVEHTVLTCADSLHYVGGASTLLLSPQSNAMFLCLLFVYLVQCQSDDAILALVYNPLGVRQHAARFPLVVMANFFFFGVFLQSDEAMLKLEPANGVTEILHMASSATFGFALDRPNSRIFVAEESSFFSTNVCGAVSEVGLPVLLLFCVSALS